MLFWENSSSQSYLFKCNIQDLLIIIFFCSKLIYLVCTDRQLLSSVNLAVNIHILYLINSHMKKAETESSKIWFIPEGGCQLSFAIFDVWIRRVHIPSILRWSLLSLWLVLHHAAVFQTDSDWQKGERKKHWKQMHVTICSNSLKNVIHHLWCR